MDEECQTAAVPDYGRALLCTAVTAGSVASALEEIAEACSSGADVVELRLDFYSDFSPAQHLRQLLAACTLPFIVTYRPVWEGGKYEGSEEDRLRTLRHAAELGAPYIDVEFAARAAFHADGETLPSHTRLIMSHHNFDRTLGKAELQAMEREMREAGAHIAKFAMTAQDITDAWTMIEILRERTGPMISLSMGERGLITRVLATKYGGFLTFGALGSGRESAPGQPTIRQLKELYRCNAHDADTRVCGIIGCPVSHSKSPILHNAAMAAIGWNGVYIPLLVDDFDRFLATFTDLDWAGFSVTIPHKGAACRLSHPDPVAGKIGAVNTLVRQPDGSMEGHNTDWEAAIIAVEEGLRAHGTPGPPGGASPLQGLHAVVLGTGGAGRALAFGAAQRGASVVIAGRSLDKATALAKEVGAQVSVSVTGCDIEDVRTGKLAATDVLLNTTPVGMVGPEVNESPVPQQVLGQYRLVFDAVYTPLETRLLREAKAEGCIIVDGLEMFVGQAGAQFTYWTGLESPVLHDMVQARSIVLKAM